MRFASFPVTLRQLQYVVAVAKDRSFRRAAERCAVSQPSLSAQIAEVERALDVVLFERDRRRVLVTAAGEEVVRRARAVLIGAEDLLDAAQRYVDPLAGPMRLGVIPTVGPYLLPDLDPALRSAFPKLQLRWTEDKTENLVRQVEAGELEAAVLAEESELGALEHALIGVDPFVLAAARRHPLATAGEAVDTAALRSQDVLLLDDGHCFRDQALDVCAHHGARELGFRATSLSTLVQMVAGGDHVTLLPGIAVPVENRRGLLQVLPFSEPRPVRTLVLAWRRHSPLDESLRALASAAREAFAKHE